MLSITTITTFLKYITLPIAVGLAHKIFCKCHNCQDWECKCFEGFMINNKYIQSKSFNDNNENDNEES